MIITPDERSPLKGSVSPTQPYRAPPPPYGAAAGTTSLPSQGQGLSISAPPGSYFPATPNSLHSAATSGGQSQWPPHLPHPHFYPLPGPPIVRRTDPSRTALRRFTRAWLIAILCLFLWGILLGGIQVAFYSNPNPHGRYSKWLETIGIRRPNRRDIPECNGPSAHTTEPPILPLPIDYPVLAAAA